MIALSIINGKNKVPIFSVNTLNLEGQKNYRSAKLGSRVHQLNQTENFLVLWYLPWHSPDPNNHTLPKHRLRGRALKLNISLPEGLHLSPRMGSVSMF